MDSHKGTKTRREWRSRVDEKGAQVKGFKVIRIARKELPILGGSLGPNPEIAQNALPGASLGTVGGMSASGAPSDFPVKRLEVPTRKSFIKRRAARFLHTDLSVDDGIVNQCIKRTEVREFFQRPFEPQRIARREIKQYAGIDDYHHCPLTSRKIESVDPRPLSESVHLAAMALPLLCGRAGAMAITGRPAWTITNVSTSWRGRIPAALRWWRGSVTWHLLVVFISKTLTDSLSYFKPEMEQSSGKKQIPQHQRLYASMRHSFFSSNPISCL